MNDELPLNEHPNPYFERKSYFSLNGDWGFLLNEEKDLPFSYSEKIVVPFSIESDLSKIKKHVSKKSILHYRKEFVVPKEYEGKRLILHFEKVDQIAFVYFNKKLIGSHFGGYLPFQFDLGKCEGKNEIELICKDDTDSPIFPRGKQSNKPKGIWYTPTSGVYGPIYIEAVPEKMIKSFKLIQNFDDKKLSIHISYEGNNEDVKVEIIKDDIVLTNSSFDKKGETCIDCSSFFYPWSPESPFLYKLRFFTKEDEVYSSFGFRKFSIVSFKGHNVFALNNKPYFCSGVLDQGYFPGGDLTPSSYFDYEKDIILMKSLGFNCLRKHIKVELNRFYFLCDKLGMIVMQDFVNSGYKYKDFLIKTAPFIPYKFIDTKTYSLLGRKSKESRQYFESQLIPYLTYFSNQTCIAIFTLFNEGWGQFDSVRLSKIAKEYLNGRLLDSNSGWYDQGCGDFYSKHVYFKKIKIKSKDERVLSLTEFGGYSYQVSSLLKRSFGYGKCKNKEQFNKKIKDVYEKEVIPCKEKNGLSIAIYTQLSDVEGEINGLVSFDRNIVKVDAFLMKELNKKLRFNSND
ncbi:MAG TPA: glycoside hydrolase family 2 [Firmicutes bacterium]|nr:glycoside hydrolase family 2 [Bacillota bacterium]